MYVHIHIYTYIHTYITYPHGISYPPPLLRGTGLIICSGFGSASGIHVKDAVAFLLPFYMYIYICAYLFIY